MTTEPTTSYSALPAILSPDLSGLVAQDLQLKSVQVQAVLKMHQDKATVPFMARYRKEATGGLDEVQIRQVVDKYQFYQEVLDRQATILKEIDKQGRLTDDLKQKIESTLDKQALEDLYLPYKPKRRTRAQIAREKGLLPLAEQIWAQPRDKESIAPLVYAERFVSVDNGVETVEEAWAMARDIVAEMVSEHPEVRALLRQMLMTQAQLVVEKREEVTAPTKFENYYQHTEAIKTIPSHRYLAICRGEHENVLQSKIVMPEEVALKAIEQVLSRCPQSLYYPHLLQAIKEGYKRLLIPSIESEIRVELKLRADQSAVDIFAHNLRAILLHSPLGGHTVIGIDPGQRTGCKTVVVDKTGKLLAHDVLYLTQGESAQKEAERLLCALITQYQPHAIAIGNGTHGRETDAFVRDTLKKHQLEQRVLAVMVNESGASVYSASDYARSELPDVDLTVRGAVSIGRRLQDPLAELVKIDPQSIGVGQYQHDVFQGLLSKKLDEVVEDCVNQVGVDLNTASEPLLSRVAGIGPSLAKRIVAYRHAHGPFGARDQLLKVQGLGPKTFEQCAGFLRILNALNPLDASSVHPERYAVVQQMAQDLGVPLSVLIGNKDKIEHIAWTRYVNDTLGQPTILDILNELKKPGRDPRQTFQAPVFQDSIRQIEDLKPGLAFTGIVTNVTAFGVFVDIGVHQDGLVHISELTEQYIKDPNEVVRAGDQIKVWVLSVDVARKRISLSAKRNMAQSDLSASSLPKTPVVGQNQRVTQKQAKPKFSNSPFAGLLK